MVIGDADLWADTFPDGLIPRIIDLVTETWVDFVKPVGTDHEVEITRRFKQSLRQAKDLRRLPVRIERETAEDHLETGAEIGRIDLKFMPSERALDRIYFAFECKRLNVSDSKGDIDTLAPEYVKQGMMRFMTGQYAATLTHGGMIGYVLDGRCSHAMGLVEKNIRANVSELKMTAPGVLDKSTLRASDEFIRATVHHLAARDPFLLHHLFLSANIKQAN